jgi:hypothetical protein
MAVTVTSGRVENVKVGDDYGFVQLRDAVTNEVEIFIIWFSDRPGGPVGFWTLQLMTALVHRLPVEVSHEADSAFLLQVKVRARPWRRIHSLPRSDRNDDEQRQIERVRTAKDRAAPRLRRYPNVIGVGVGYKNVRDQATPTVCVRVYVKKKVPEPELAPSDVVPKKVNGVPTDVIEDTFTTHAVLPVSEHRRRRAILNAGISIGNAITGGSGTLGACVFDAHSGAQLLLSNWHVLCGRANCNPGEAIIQPGTGGGDGGRVGDIVARLSRASLSDVVDAGGGGYHRPPVVVRGSPRTWPTDGDRRGRSWWRGV